jgi:hypothetical protein
VSTLPTLKSSCYPSNCFFLLFKHFNEEEKSKRFAVPKYDGTNHPVKYWKTETTFMYYLSIKSVVFCKIRINSRFVLKK